MYLWLLYASDSALDNETSKFDGGHNFMWLLEACVHDGRQ